MLFLSKIEQTLCKNWIKNIEKRRSVSVEGVNSIKHSLQPLKETSRQSCEEKEGSNNQATILQKENYFAATKFVFLCTHCFKGTRDAILAS